MRTSFAPAIQDGIGVRRCRGQALENSRGKPSQGRAAQTCPVTWRESHSGHMVLEFVAIAPAVVMFVFLLFVGVLLNQPRRAPGGANCGRFKKLEIP